MNTMNPAKSTARIERFSQLASSAALLLGAMLAFAVTVFPVAAQARNDDGYDRDDNPAYGYNRQYDPDARFPGGPYPRGDWDRDHGGYSGNYDLDKPNNRFYEAPYAHGHHDRDRDRDRDNDNDQDENNNDHSHHHHHHHSFFGDLF